MKKFKFGLENVLKVRSIHKKIAEREVSATQSRINKKEQDLANNEQALSDSFNMLAQQDTQRSFWNDLTYRYQQGLRYRRDQLVEQRDQLAERLEGEKRALTRKMKEEMVIEKLKDYQKAEHERLSEMEEQAEIEEIDLLKRGHLL